MIRMIPSKSAGHAKTYFSDALSKSDYYTSDQELQGYLKGKLADRLGVTGPATKRCFSRLRKTAIPSQKAPHLTHKRRPGYGMGRKFSLSQVGFNPAYTFERQSHFGRLPTKC